MKRAKVFVNSKLAGMLTEDDMGYEFRYDSDFDKLDGNSHKTYRRESKIIIMNFLASGASSDCVE